MERLKRPDVDARPPSEAGPGGVCISIDSERLGLWVRFRAFVVDPGRIAQMDARDDDGRVVDVGLDEHRRVTGLILRYYHLWRRNEWRNSPAPTAPC